jgi:hypothetical protein
VPDHFKLVDIETGECFDPRCKASNRCPHCRAIAARETIEMLVLDAVVDAPTIMLTLTARRFPAGGELRRTLAKIVKACRRRWPEFQWFVPRERQERGELHIHPLVKHVPDDDGRELYELVTRIWCARHDAVAYPFDRRADGPQGLKLVADGQGLVRYLTKDLAHSLKSAQALEMGFRGHRTSQTRGYFGGGAAVARAAARESLRRRAATWKLAEQGLGAEEIAAELDRERRLELRRLAVPHEAARGTSSTPDKIAEHIAAAALAWREERELIDWCLEAGRLSPPGAAGSDLDGKRRGPPAEALRLPTFS